MRRPDDRLTEWRDVLQIRTLTLSDVPFAMRLVEIVGWNQLPADWHRLIRIAPQGCFLAEWDGQPAATATAVAYGTDCAWVGMVLVHPDFRRRGIAAGADQPLPQLPEVAGCQDDKA